METKGQSVNSSPLRLEGDSRCATHSHKKVTFVCYDCNSLICGNCVTSIHHGHIMEELSDALPSIKSKLDLSITSMETEQLPRVQSCIEMTEQRLIDNAKQIKDVVCVMKLQGDKCKDEIDDMVDECVSMCEKLGKENMELLFKYLAEHKARLQDLTEQIKYRRQVMITGSNVTMFDALCNVPTYDTIECPSLHTAHFSPCEVVTDLLKQALGQLNTSFDSLQSSTNHCHSGPESQVSNVVNGRSANEPSKTANGNNTPGSTDEIELPQKPSSHSKSSARPHPQQSIGLRSGRHPPRPTSDRVRVKSPGSQNRHHQRSHPRSAIFKRRNSMEAPSSIHRFLTARPSTSSDIRPMITVKSSSQSRDAQHVSMSISRRHERRSMSLPSGHKPESPSNVPSPSLLQAILSSSHEPSPPKDRSPHIDHSSQRPELLHAPHEDPSSPITNSSQKPELRQVEVSSKEIEPQNHHLSSHKPEVQATEVIERSPQNDSDQQLSSPDQEPEATKAPPPKPERTSKAASKRNVHHPVILSQFPSPCAITSICLTSEGHAWTCDEESRVLTLLGNAGDVIKTVMCKANVNDISMSPKTHHLWYCTWKCRVVELNSETDTRMRRFTTESWPRCLCVTDNEDILIGAENKITLYNAEGHVIITTDTGMSGVIRPTRLTQCPLTGNVAFLEKTSSQCDGKDNGHVVVLDNTLSVKFRYKGECETSNSAASAYFDPFDVKYDDKGYLLVGDFTSSTLDLVTGAGNHIRTLLTDTGSSQAIGMHTDGVMWAAFKSDNNVSHVKILKY